MRQGIAIWVNLVRISIAISGAVGSCYAPGRAQGGIWGHVHASLRAAKGGLALVFYYSCVWVMSIGLVSAALGKRGRVKEDSHALDENFLSSSNRRIFFCLVVSLQSFFFKGAPG